MLISVNKTMNMGYKNHTLQIPRIISVPEVYSPHVTTQAEKHACDYTGRKTCLLHRRLSNVSC